jgi:hypothetical protein
MKNLQNWEQFNENNVNIDDDFLNEKALSDLQKEYRKYFKEMLAIYNVKSPAKLSKEMKKDFFKNIRKYWVKGKGPSKLGEELSDAIGEK